MDMKRGGQTAVCRRCKRETLVQAFPFLFISPEREISGVAPGTIAEEIDLELELCRETLQVCLKRIKRCTGRNFTYSILYWPRFPPGFPRTLCSLRYKESREGLQGTLASTRCRRAAQQPRVACSEIAQALDCTKISELGHTRNLNHGCAWRQPDAHRHPRGPGHVSVGQDTARQHRPQPAPQKNSGPTLCLNAGAATRR